MSQHSIRITPTLCSLSGTFGEIQVVAAANRLIVDIAARNWDTAGHLHRQSAVLSLPLDDAISLHTAIGQAIVVASDTALQTAPTWSDRTHSTVVRRSGRRAA